MADAQHRGWGHPDERGYRERNIVSVNAGGVRLNVHRAVARLFKGFIDDLVAKGYRLDVVADDWGWVNRDIRGRPGVKSNHAWGLAVDLNSTGNPMTEAHPGHANTGGHDHRGVHTDMPPWTGDLARRWGLTWGANYSGTRKDAMHFEFLGRPEDVTQFPQGSTIDEEDDMLTIIRIEETGHHYLMTGAGLRHIPSGGDLARLTKAKHIIIEQSKQAVINYAGRDTAPGGVWLP